MSDDAVPARRDDTADPARPNASRPDNHVYLRGRLSAEPVERELPSGDVLLSFSVTVPRPPGDRVRVDSLECVAVRPGLRRVLGRAVPGEELEVEGTLQRRFWRSPTGPASRYAVVVSAVRRTKSPKSQKSQKPQKPQKSTESRGAGTVTKGRRRAGA